MVLCRPLFLDFHKRILSFGLWILDGLQDVVNFVKGLIKVVVLGWLFIELDLVVKRI